MANFCFCYSFLATTVCCAALLATTAVAAVGSSSARLLNRGFSVREGEPNGTMVTQLSGRDLDVGQQRINIPVDATLRLLLPNDKLFTIRPGGQLVTASQLDREAICSSPDYNAYMDGDQCYVDVVVLVIAGDSAQRVRIPILIQDVNDNAPSWPEASITVNVREETPNFQLRLPVAVDRDSAQYGVKRYRLTAGRELNLFEITGSPREPTLRVLHKLDREKQASYNLTVEATDGSRAGHLDVLVTVTDVNDNAPAFQHSVYHFTVAEDTMVDMPIAQLSAIDADMGLNGLVTYSILLSAPEYCSSMFSVDASSGTLSVAAPLDYERTASCVFTVQATDQSEAERRSNVTIVNVTIVDVNDNVPQISVVRDGGEEKPLSVLENAPPGTIVGYVCPSDNDKNRHQRVDCQSLSPQFVLVLVDPCFQLRLASQLDREAHPTASASVVVNCSDRGFDKSHEIIRNLTVLIDDVNDNQPHFSQQEYHFYVPEGELNQRPLGRVVAFDPDAQKNAEIVFNITKNSYVVHPNNRQPAFRIAQDGDLFATTQFDRELNDTYVLEVVASDRGTPRLSSSATVIVHVTDKNDNAPVFLSAERYQFSAVENLQSVTPIGKVTATDRDTGANAYVRYALSAKDQMYFRVNESGHIFTTGDKLDREVNLGRYDLLVYAIDSAEAPEPQRTATARVLVTIQDVNDNRPTYITAKNTTFVVDMLHAKVGDVIGKVEAVDMDDPLNGNGAVRYSDRRNSSIFAVDDQTGDIRIARPLSTPGFYSMLIRAEDAGNPPLHDLISINIIVTGGHAEATESSRRISAETFQSILLVGTLSAVAAVLSVILMITIYFLRRQERRRTSSEKRRQPPTGSSRRHAGRSPTKSGTDNADAKRAMLSPQAHEALIQTPQTNPIVAFSPVDCSGTRCVPAPISRTRTLPKCTQEIAHFKSCLEVDDQSSLLTPSNNSQRRSASFEALPTEEVAKLRVQNQSLHNMCHDYDASANWTGQGDVIPHETQKTVLLANLPREDGMAVSNDKDVKVLSWFARCTPVDETAANACTPEDAPSLYRVDDGIDSGKGTSDECGQPHQQTSQAAAAKGKGQTYLNSGRPGTNIYASSSSRWCVEPQADASSGRQNVNEAATLRTFSRDARAAGSPLLYGMHTSRTSCSSSTMSSTLRKKQLRFADQNASNSVHSRSHDEATLGDNNNNNNSNHGGGSSSSRGEANSNATNNQLSFKYDGTDNGDGSIGFRIC